MHIAKELRKLAAKLAQEAPFSVGGFYPNGREFGREFYDYEEAKDYFDAAQNWAASVSLFEDDEEIDSFMK